jgi:hypothetical protein
MAGHRGRGGADSRCFACGAPLLVQWVGERAALKARVALPSAKEPLPYGPAAAQAPPGDLVWCLPRLPHRALRLRWTGRRHPPDCPHQHLTTHQCPPTTLF